MRKRVYLSSTKLDLDPYRAAAKEALTKIGYEVVDSYEASPTPAADKCQADVCRCDIYVGIFAGHYGWQPDGYGGSSITELEYRAAVRALKPRFIFMRDLKDCSGEELDAIDPTLQDAYARLLTLRAELQNGKTHTYMPISDPKDLALKVTQALFLAAQPGGLFSEAPPHPRQLDIGLLIVGVRGDDDAAVERIRAQLPAPWQAATALFDPGQGLAAQFAALDDKLVRARCVALRLSPAGRSRLDEQPAARDALVRMLHARLGSYDLLTDDAAAPLPASWPAPAACFPIGHWLAEGGDLHGGQLAELINAFPTRDAAHADVSDGGLVGLAYSVLAMTRQEASELAADPARVQAKFGEDSHRIFAAIAGKLGDGGNWPARYGDERRSWKPFGTDSVRDILEWVVTRINEQDVVSRRDQNALRNNRIRLRHYPFEPAAFDADSEQWPLLERMRTRGCLVLVDELSTFHPDLGISDNLFLSDPAVTMATLSALDPPLYSLDAQIKGPRKIVDLTSRFTLKLDPRCELAINNTSRMRRWLRQVLPETLAGLEAQGAAPELRSSFRANPSGR